jgi:hypothetical protein
VKSDLLLKKANFLDFNSHLFLEAIVLLSEISLPSLKYFVTFYRGTGGDRYFNQEPTTNMADDSALVEAEEIPDVSYDPRGYIQPESLQQELQRPSSLPLQDDVEIFSQRPNTLPDLIVAVFVVHFDTRKGMDYELKDFNLRRV